MKNESEMLKPDGMNAFVSMPRTIDIAAFPISAVVVQVKTGPRSTAHLRIHIIRPNGWLRHSFAQWITLLDFDGIG